MRRGGNWTFTPGAGCTQVAGFAPAVELQLTVQTTRLVRHARFRCSVLWSAGKRGRRGVAEGRGRTPPTASVCDRLERQCLHDALGGKSSARCQSGACLSNGDLVDRVGSRTFRGAGAVRCGHTSGTAGKCAHVHACIGSRGGPHRRSAAVAAYSSLRCTDGGGILRFDFSSNHQRCTAGFGQGPADAARCRCSSATPPLDDQPRLQDQAQRLTSHSEFAPPDPDPSR